LRARSVAAKIQQAIRAADLFVAVFTRRVGPGRGASAWIVEEKGYSLGQKATRPMVLLVERGLSVPEDTGGLEGDLEYITFDRYELDSAREKLRSMLASVLPAV
jgi:hypothetical protein